MMQVLSILIVAVFVGAISYICTSLFGKDIGSGVTVGVTFIAYLALKYYTDYQEKLLYKDLKNMSNTEKRKFLDDAKKAGLLENNDENS